MKIAVLGLGAMGVRMAARLMAAGHELTVWNRSPGPAEGLASAGVKIAASPRRAAEGAAVALAMVRDDEASEAVWRDPTGGALWALAPGSVAMECSTLSPGHVGRLCEAARAAGVDFLEAPVLGSRPQAAAGELVFLTGGKAAVSRRLTPLMLTMGLAVHHVGAAGSAARLKLMINALLAGQVAQLAEVMALAERLGLARGRMAEILARTSVASPVLQRAAESMAARDFAPMFPVELVAKDLEYARLAAAAVGARTPILELLGGLYDEARRSGLGREQISAVVRVF